MAQVKGNGSIRSREPEKPNRSCRKWQLRVDMGKDAEGKRVRRSRAFAGTYKQAQKALSEFIDELNQGKALDSACTFGEYYAEWHQLRIDSKDYSERTIDGEDNKMRNVLKHLGSRKLSELTARDFDKMYAKLKSGETMSGRPLSGTSCANTHKVVVSIMKAADRDGLLQPGVVANLKAPKNDTIEKEALTPQQIAALLQKLSPEQPMHMMIMLCVLCGLRRSEVLALTWEDVAGDAIRINKDLNEDGTVKECPKTKAGNRYVPMPKEIRDALVIRRLVQGMMIGNAQKETTPIIDNLGAYYRPHSATTWWRDHKGELGVNCTLHELRHSYATMLIAQDVDIKTVQDILGHATPDVTLGIYAHVHDEQRKKAAESIDALLTNF